MVSRVLFRKLRRDLWRQRRQFLATAAVIAIGVAVYVAATDAYANLGQSFDRAYAIQRLPDVILTGPSASGLRDAAQDLPGDPIAETRQQRDVGVRVDGRPLLGRAIGVPAGAQPAVSELALRSGALPARGEVLVEEHLAQHYRLKPGATVELLGPAGWQAVPVSGSALSTEYFWPARSQQELLTTPEHFGVVFVPADDLGRLAGESVDQLLLYARDRSAAPALVTAAAELARSNRLVLTTRDEQPSYRALQDDVESVGTFAGLLPWVFLVAAVAGTYVLLSRLVAAQRAVIGTLSANGLSGRVVRTHYLGYGIAVGLAGSALGLAGGYWLGGWFTTRYTQALGLPLRVTSLHPMSLVIGAVVGTAAAAIAAWVPARAASRMGPAEAMRIAPPGGRGSVSVIERMLPPLRGLPARWRMTLRGITRNRRRTLLTVTGVAISVCLVMLIVGLRDTVNSVIERQFGGIELQDAQVLTVPGAAATVAAALRKNPRIATAEEFTRLDVGVQADGNRYDTLLIALPQATRMHRFSDGRRQLNLPADGVLLGLGLSGVLGIDVGDRVSIIQSQNGTRFDQRVVGFVDEPMSPVVYMSTEQLSGIAATTGVMLKLAPDATERDIAGSAMAVPGVVAYLSSASLHAMVRDAFSLYDALVGVMLVFAAVMAAALLYNAMAANVGERTGELGTLRAAGMGPGLLGRLVAAENVFLAVVGLPIGLVAGRLLADWFMSRYETQGFHWHLEMQATTPLFVALTVFAAALLAQVPAFRVIARMDVAKVVRERSL